MLVLVAAVLLMGCLPAAAMTLRVENRFGAIHVRTVAGDTLTVRRHSPDRTPRDTDARITRTPGLVLVEAEPPDGARIDLELDVPYRFELELRTACAALSVTGFLPRVDARTDTGDVRLAMPWAATRLEASAATAPLQLVLPERIRFREERRAEWSLRDRLPATRTAYGRVKVSAQAPARFVIEDIDIPEDAPIKLPWQAGAIVEDLLRAPSRPASPASESAAAAAVDETGVRFSTEVRMVNLTVSVFDAGGHPVLGLASEDFEVREDGIPQKITFAGSEEVPFNLALLLDLSGSTQRERAAMKEAAKRFVRIARFHDRVAAYAMAADLFQVVSPLTADRTKLERLIESIPPVAGSSPLYDTLAVAYAQEFRRRPAERNALIVITDGIDNRLHEAAAPAEVPFARLLRAVSAMNMVIYPVFLDPFTRVPPPRWAKQAREQMEALARASGGRLFPARSLQDLEPVYPAVAQELRSVYTLAYYPANQNFDGRWRRVEVKVRRPRVHVRTRGGYFGR